MDQHTISVAPNIADALIGFAKLLIAKKFVIAAGSALAIAVMTYSMLNLFMNPGLKFAYGKRKMSEDVAAKFKIAALMVFLCALPLIAAIAPMFASFRRPAFSASIKGILIAFLISAVICWLMSRILARFAPEEKRKHFMIIEAFATISSTTSDYIAEWITRGIMWIVNTCIKIIHRPFILEYAIVAVLLNLTFSFILIGIIGVSQEAGYTNVLGSLLGGTAHYLFKRKQIAKLREEYVANAANATLYAEEDQDD